MTQQQRIQQHIENLGGSEVVAQRAERCLIRFGEAAVAATLPFADDTRPDVRFRVAWILGKSRDPQALPVLIALTEDPDERVRYDATLALGELGDRRSLPTLEQLIGDSTAISSAAIMALRKLQQA